uniref:3'-5' exonuclease domain-containing protein n=1 Tax=Heterorhabditis bacteriophora TaxID=37862 RepID=A0A1I7X1Q2_HETBA
MWHSDQALAEHPYQYEIDHFNVPESQLDSYPPIVILLIKVTITFVLHHDHRSFMGLTCLLQISTRENDYIIDPFPLWMNMHILNEPFTNPKILKVFHGAERDIIWLQRDFGIYVINMFDTYRAMRRLDLPKFSLQFLVQKYCSVTLMKEFQMSDWRIRPLPPHLLDYARGDTHYLLFCYDKLREELLEKGNELKNLLKAVYTESIETCGKKAIANFWALDVHLTMVSFMLWSNYGNGEINNTVQALPREMQGIIACCSPVPLMVKERLLELHKSDFLNFLNFVYNYCKCSTFFYIYIYIYIIEGKCSYFVKLSIINIYSTTKFRCVCCKIAYLIRRFQAFSLYYFSIILQARLYDEQRKQKELGINDESKKLFSHHDEAVSRKPVADVDVGEISLCDGSSSQFTDEMLTKKALKRKKKHVCFYSTRISWYLYKAAYNAFYLDQI